MRSLGLYGVATAQPTGVVLANVPPAAFAAAVVLALALLASTGPGRRQLLTPPAVRPETMRRWKISTMITSGTVTIVPAAMIVAYGCT